VRVEITVAEDGAACGSPTRLRLLADDPEDDPAQALDARAQHALAPPATCGKEQQGAELGGAERSEGVDQASSEEACGEDGDSRESITPVLVGASPVKPPVRPRRRACLGNLTTESAYGRVVERLRRPCSGQTCTPAGHCPVSPGVGAAAGVVEGVPGHRLSCIQVPHACCACCSAAGVRAGRHAGVQQ